MYIQTEGLVLRETAYKDYDKMLTILTRTEGKLSVFARGARRRGSPLLASTQLLAYGDFQLFAKDHKFQVDEADTIDLFFALRQDLEAFSLGTYFAELMDTGCAEGVPLEDVLRLGVWMCRILGLKKRPLPLVKGAFELRLMTHLGFEPQLDYCELCGKVPEAPGFHLVQGSVHCPDCRGGMPQGISVQLSAGAYAAMRHIVRCEPQKICSFTLEPFDLAVFGAACEQFTLTQTERSYHSLSYYNQLMNT